MNRKSACHSSHDDQDEFQLQMVVSPAVLAHDVLAHAGDVSMEIAVFPIGRIYPGSFEKLEDC